MANKIKLFADLDGTLAEWRAAAGYEELFREGYFATLETHAPVVEAFKMLNESGIVEPYILSAYLTESKYALREKNLWVSQYVPFVDLGHRLFVPQGISKPDYVAALLGDIDSQYVLLDDYSRNLHEWRAVGGIGIKLLNGINGTVGTWKGPAVSRFESAEDIYRKIRDILK